MGWRSVHGAVSDERHKYSRSFIFSYNDLALLCLSGVWNATTLLAARPGTAWQAGVVHTFFTKLILQLLSGRSSGCYQQTKAILEVEWHSTLQNHGLAGHQVILFAAVPMAALPSIMLVTCDSGEFTELQRMPCDRIMKFTE